MSILNFNYYFVWKEPGDLVLARYAADGCIYRARVEQIEHSKVNVS